MKIAPALVLALLLSPTIIAGGEPGEKAERKKPKLSAETLSGLKFRNIGPALMSGRISDLAVDPAQPNTWYLAVGSGNLWKTTNAGTTWSAIFENHGSYSIGCVTVDPRQRHIIWVGTGEAVGGRHVGYGDGIYKSLDGGKSFKNMGLKQSQHIAKIVVDPRDSQVVYAAAQGPLWAAGAERGLYKTTNASDGSDLQPTAAAPRHLDTALASGSGSADLSGLAANHVGRARRAPRIYDYRRRGDRLS